jgi:hypothetical protein
MTLSKNDVENFARTTEITSANEIGNTAKKTSIWCGEKHNSGSCPDKGE